MSAARRRMKREARREARKIISAPAPTTDTSARVTPLRYSEMTFEQLVVGKAYAIMHPHPDAGIQQGILCQYDSYMERLT